VELVDHAVRDGLDTGFFTGCPLDLGERWGRNEIDHIAIRTATVTFVTIIVITCARVFSIATVSASLNATLVTIVEKKGLGGGHEQDDRVVAFDERLDRAGNEGSPADRDCLWLVNDDDRAVECGEFPRL
jgi:hypothetical protein